MHLKADSIYQVSKVFFTIFVFVVCVLFNTKALLVVGQNI